jgi:hypothetical protein
MALITEVGDGKFIWRCDCGWEYPRSRFQEISCRRHAQTIGASNRTQFLADFACPTTPIAAQKVRIECQLLGNAYRIRV